VRIGYSVYQVGGARLHHLRHVIDVLMARGAQSSARFSGQDAARSQYALSSSRHLHVLMG